MANKQANAKPYAVEIAQLVRGSLLEGLRVIRHRTGKTNSEIFADWIETDGLGVVLDKVAKYMPRELKVDQNVTIGIESLLSDLPKAIEARHKAENELQATDTTYTRITDQADRVATIQLQRSSADSSD